MNKTTTKSINPGYLYWFPTLYFVLHSAEELAFDFPAWATRSFGTTSLPFFIYHHILLFVGLVICSYLAKRPSKQNTWRVLATAWQVQFAVNGAFHLVTTVLFKEYAPGVITGTVVIWPLTYYFFKQTLHRKLLSKSQVKSALIVGILIAALVIASLWLDGNITWRLL